MKQYNYSEGECPAKEEYDKRWNKFRNYCFALGLLFTFILINLLKGGLL